MTNAAEQKIIGYYTEDGKVFLEKDCSQHFGGARGCAVNHVNTYSYNNPDEPLMTIYQICEQDVIGG